MRRHYFLDRPLAQNMHEAGLRTPY